MPRETLHQFCETLAGRLMQCPRDDVVVSFLRLLCPLCDHASALRMARKASTFLHRRVEPQDSPVARDEEESLYMRLAPLLLLRTLPLAGILAGDARHAAGELAALDRQFLEELARLLFARYALCAMCNLGLWMWNGVESLTHRFWNIE